MNTVLQHWLARLQTDEQLKHVMSTHSGNVTNFVVSFARLPKNILIGNVLVRLVPVKYVNVPFGETLLHLWTCMAVAPEVD